MTYTNDVLGVSRETVEQLREFTALVQKWTQKINLISSASADTAFERHTLDSAQLYQMAPMNAESWADIGSGGGFPGIVIAIIAKAKGRDLDLTLVEADQRKCAFLLTAVRTFDLNCHVLTERIETLPPLDADVISARALAPLSTLFEYVERHGNERTVALFPKGRKHLEEVSAARQVWNFSSSAIQSITNPEAAILRIEGVSRAS